MGKLFSLSAAATAGLFIMGSAAHAGVFYDTNGFEASSGANNYSATGPTNGTPGNNGSVNPYSGIAGDLLFQPYSAPYGTNTNISQWTPDQNTPTSSTPNDIGMPAIVETSVVKSGSQAVSYTRNANSVDTRWTPQFNEFSTSLPVLTVDWDMRVASGGTGNTLFGMEVNDFAASGDKRIGYLVVNQQTGQLIDSVAGVETPIPATTVANDTWHHYSFQADYSTQTYRIYLDNALVDTKAFEAGTLMFTDASLVGFNNGSGTAYYDNYVLASVPEPSTLGLAGMLCPAALLLRRRRETAK